MKKGAKKNAPGQQLLADYIDDHLVRGPPPPKTTTTKPTHERAAKRPADAAETNGPAAKRPKLTLKGPTRPRRSARNKTSVAEDISGDVEEAAKEAAEILLSLYREDAASKVAKVAASQLRTPDEDVAVAALAALKRAVNFEPATDDNQEGDGDDDDDDDATTAAGPSNTTSKKPWAGTPTGQGTSQEKPPVTIHKSQKLLSTPWNCAVPDCNTGFTWVKRDDNDGISRKMISQFFGRNKKQTANIDPDVWHVYCRKHYQRAKYVLDNVSKAEACREQIFNIRTQLDRIQLWRPNARFTVQLTKAMVNRMRHWDACMQNANNDTTQAQIAFDTKYPTISAKGKEINPAEATFPRALADTFLANHCGTNFSIARLHRILNWVRGRVDAGVMTVMPPMEFLISEMRSNEAGVTDPKRNYQMWLASDNS